MNKIALYFDRTTDKISGNPYGVSTYETQVRDKIDWSDLNIIIFPEHIKDIGSSFIQGFSKHIILKVGRSKYKEIIQYETSSEDLTRKLNVGSLL